MSHTPLDGPDGGTREEGESPDHDVPDDGLRGFLARTRGVLSRAGGAVRRLFVGSPDGPDPADSDPAGGRLRSTGHPMERSLPSPDGEEAPTRPVVSERRENGPVPAGPSGRSRERPELVARWQDDRLTLAEPDEAGARLSSDTWSEVDR